MLYNGSHKRTLAKGNRNSVCITYSSPHLKAMLAAMPPKPATLSGAGSVAHAGTTPAAYCLAACSKHMAVVGNTTVLLQDAPFEKCYHPELGITLFWCTQCRNWVVNARQYVPRPPAPKLTATQVANSNTTKHTPSYTKPYSYTTTGNAMTGERI